MLFTIDSNGDGACGLERGATRSRGADLSRVNERDDVCVRVRVDVEPDEGLERLVEVFDREGVPCERVPRRDSLLMVHQQQLALAFQTHQVEIPGLQQHLHPLCQRWPQLLQQLMRGYPRCGWPD